MQVFQPDLYSSNLTLWISLTLMLLGAALTFFLFKKYKTLSLLSFFIAIIAACSTFFSFWTTQKLVPVQISAEKLITPYGETALSEIKSSEIKGGAIDASIIKKDDTRILLIVERSNKTHALSELNYPIDSIKNILDNYLLTDERK